MENNIKNQVVDYGVIAHRRFYRKEKIRFIQRIESEFKQMGYQTSVLSPQGSKGKAINLLIGDIKKAKTIIIVNYDTPVKSFGFFKYKPFDLRKRNMWYMLSVFVPLNFITFFCFFFSTFFLKIEWLLGIFHWQDVFALLLYLIGIILLVHYSKGIANSRNLNRNTSGIIGLLKLARMMKDEKRNDIAFVLCDYGCINHLGDQMVKAYLKSYDKQKFIMLDCIGVKGITAVCYSDAFTDICNKLHREIKQYHANREEYSAACLYPNTMIISVGQIENNNLVIPNVNTRKDIDIDVEQIVYVCEQIKKIL